MNCIKITPEILFKINEENNEIYKGAKIGGYAWEIDNVEVLENPIEINGKLSLWNYEF